MNASRYRLLYALAKIYWFITRPKTRGVMIVLFDLSESKILLVRNTYGQKTWNLPGGGIKTGETPEQAAHRETKEEVGLQIKNMRGYGSFKAVHDFKRDTMWVFSGIASSGELQVSSGEIEIAKWFRVQDLPSDQSIGSRRGISMVISS